MCADERIFFGFVAASRAFMLPNSDSVAFHAVLLTLFTQVLGDIRLSGYIKASLSHPL